MCQKRTHAAQHVATAHGEAREVKLGGFNEPTQDVSGACGAARNEAITAWAQGDAGMAASSGHITEAIS
jgi:hypothetical protein